MAQYESEFTQFMRDWMAAHPEQVAVQNTGRALWWDKSPRPLEAIAQDAAAKVPVKPYYYDID